MEYYSRSLKDDSFECAEMSVLELGIFSRLLDYFLINEKPIPLDIKKICKICKTRSHQKIDSILIKHFKKTEEGYVHVRYEKVISLVRKRIESSKNKKELYKTDEIEPVDNLWITSNEEGENPHLSTICQPFVDHLSTICQNSGEGTVENNSEINELKKNEANPFKLKSLILTNKEKNIIKGKGKSETIGFNFQKFLDAYPKKVDRRKNDKAANIWQYEKMDMHFSAIMKSIAERSEHSDWAEMIEQNNYQFMNDPATFLEKKLYEQEFTRVQPKISEDEKDRLKILKIKEEYENGEL